MRGVGFVSVVVWGLAALVYVSQWMTPAADQGGSVATPATPSGQFLAVEVRRNTVLRVTADGAVVVDRRVEPGEQLEWKGVRSLIVEGAAPEALRIEWNGQRVVPLGRQDEPRRLVFVDDAEGLR